MDWTIISSQLLTFTNHLPSYLTHPTTNHHFLLVRSMLVFWHIPWNSFTIRGWFVNQPLRNGGWTSRVIIHTKKLMFVIIVENPSRTSSPFCTAGNSPHGTLLRWGSRPPTAAFSKHPNRRKYNLWWESLWTQPIQDKWNKNHFVQ